MPNNKKQKKNSKFSKKGMSNPSNGFAVSKVSTSVLPFLKQLQTTHLHKITSFTYLVDDGNGLINLYSDLGNLLTSAPNFKQLSYVYARYRPVCVDLKIMSLRPLNSAATSTPATFLFARYSPANLSPPNSAEEITDTVGSRDYDPNKLTNSSMTFIPKFSTSPTFPVPTPVVPDSDGYLPFSLGNLGFPVPFMGCIQYYQDQTGTFGEKIWQVQWTFFVRCTFSV